MKSNTITDRIRQIRHYNGRLIWLILFIITLSLLLFSRLIYLQINQQQRFNTLSKKNQLSFRPIVPKRGLIYDRHGILLARNIPAYRIELIPEKIKHLDEVLSELQTFLPITEDDIIAFKKHVKQTPSYDPVVLKFKLSEQDVAKFSVQQYRFPGVAIKAELIRDYPLGDVMAHVLGYVGRINAKELRQLDPSNYRATQFIGKTGIEKFYETSLHGETGHEKSETDVTGRKVRDLGSIPAKRGDDLYLSIDSHLQGLGLDLFNHKRGSLVAIDPRNGEIIALVSSPSFDPNLFVQGMSTAQYARLQNAKLKPLFNRAIRGLYPPGSTIKPFIALLGLDRGVINKKFTFFDKGWFRYRDSQHIYHDWLPSGHGVVNLRRAITVSCDTFFYYLASQLHIGPITDFLHRFGLGQKTQVDLPQESAGIVPDPDWKLMNKAQSWYVGDTIITSIGQGSLLTTPLQLASATAAMSKQGKRYRPHLLLRKRDAKNVLYERVPYEEFPILLRNKRTWKTVSNAMENVISSFEGTGFRYGRDANYRVAAKTGTSQVVSRVIQRQYEQDELPEAYRDHTLFIAYAPVNNPTIAVATIVENSTESVSVGITRAFIDYYLEHDTKKQADS